VTALCCQTPPSCPSLRFSKAKCAQAEATWEANFRLCVWTPYNQNAAQGQARGAPRGPQGRHGAPLSAQRVSAATSPIPAQVGIALAFKPPSQVLSECESPHYPGNSGNPGYPRRTFNSAVRVAPAFTRRVRAGPPERAWTPLSAGMLTTFCFGWRPSSGGSIGDHQVATSTFGSGRRSRPPTDQALPGENS